MDLKKLILKPAIQFTPQNSPKAQDWAQVLLEGLKVGLERRYDWKSVEETEPRFPTSLFVAELMLMSLPYQKRRLEIDSLEGIK